MTQIKSVLLLGTPYFGYIDRIERYLINELNINCSKLYSYHDFYSFTQRILRNIPIPDKISNQLKKEYEFNLFKNINNYYDVVLILNGFNFSEEFIFLLKNKLKHSKFIFYIWDDLFRIKDKQILSYFDFICSYSKLDSLSNNFYYRPFFYSHSNDISYFKKEYDICFIGTSHSNRDFLISSFEKNKKLKFFKHNYLDFLSFLKKTYGLTGWNDYNFFKLDYERYIYFLSQSKAVLDLPHSSQNNITTRPIEAMGTRSKVISSSSLITSMDLYISDNIYILNDFDSDSFEDWLKIPYVNYSPELIDYYSLKFWCSELLNL
jgi:hypothetical protein